ncbi:MAG TPA: ROK family protein [Ktedonobacteraceae bacterium]|nr:ROK family protein [Ktedonobacteraceae bacterium]
MVPSKIPERSEKSPILVRQSGPLGASGPLATARTTGKLLATQGYVVGIEISGNGSRQTVALANLEGKVLHKIRHPLSYVPDTQSVLSLINDMLAEITDPGRLQDGRILRVGVAVGGLVDARRGIVRRLHHAHEWNNFPLQDYMAERLEAPCIIDNNANAAALAEIEYGALSEREDGHRRSEQVVLYVGLGRGIGGGLVVNGQVYHGFSSTAGEIGHMLVKEHGPKCSCGGFGHLEAIASAQAIVRRMIGLSIEYPESEAAMRQVTGARAERITTEQIFMLAAAGDKVARQVIDEVENYLGIALANIIHLINPGVIILGGPVAQAGDLLIAPLQARVQALCLAEAREGVRIIQGKLGAEANIVGAITLALQDI